MIAIEIVGAVLLADFLPGFVHWLEDAYARPGIPFVNKIAEKNLLHHVQPREFLKKSWLRQLSQLIPEPRATIHALFNGRIYRCWNYAAIDFKITKDEWQ